jgi:radical SAM protein with 4Fe4S-binding SPASM domain
MNEIFRKINRFVSKVEIVLSRTRLFSYPQNVQIEPTNRCNQRCIMCPRNTRLDVPIGDLSLDNFKKIIDKLPVIGNLQLNGLGEPLLNKELPEMIKYATSKGIKVSINSNCALVDESLAKKLIDSGLGLFKVSMDSPDPVIYGSIRNAPLEPVIGGIRTLIKIRKEKKSHTPQVWFNSIIMKNNYKNLDKVLALGDELKVDLVRFKPINIFWAGKDENLAAQTKELKEEIKKTIQAGENLNAKHNLRDLLERLEANIYQRPKESIPCYSPWTELYIQYYGGVRLCCEFCSKEDDIGNILEEDFKKIWNGKKMRQIRKEFKRGNTYFPACRACNRFQKNILIYDKIKK